MSTREISYSIFEQLTDEELEGFVALFRRIHPPKTVDADQARRDEAFRKLESMRRNIPDFDEKKHFQSTERRNTAEENSDLYKCADRLYMRRVPYSLVRKKIRRI